MRTYTQQEIDDLIRCPKVITIPPRNTMRSERGHRRNELRLTSQDGKSNFSVFMRINDDFNENFTIGLIFHSSEEPESFCLLRCNGPHGGFIGNPDLPHPHFQCHIHRAKVESIDAGERPEKGGEATDSYNSYKEALRYFLLTTNVLNAEDYFPDFRQDTLFEMEEPES